MVASLKMSRFCCCFEVETVALVVSAILSVLAIIAAATTFHISGEELYTGTSSTLATLAAVTYLLAVYAILRDCRPGLLVPALLVAAVAVVANIIVADLLLVVTTGHLGAILATLFYLSLTTFTAFSW